ncbi:hypothetical protein PR202_gb16868 [Eleusine coracana subsp. coracana]|uniref:Uncharacterized protein n=1 Tax=Eleusine coracana subsp. coracana TaxID=191504 RepID=A0AAV5F376_ELECO|nr:hypothetical protein PR202_gb16868 [Eleusine coracana subsp. coracana]
MTGRGKWVPPSSSSMAEAPQRPDLRRRWRKLERGLERSGPHQGPLGFDARPLSSNLKLCPVQSMAAQRKQ